MTKLFLIIGIFVCLSSTAQIKPFVGLEWYSSNQVLLESFKEHASVDYDQGDLSMIYGVKYRLKGFEAKTSASTFMYMDELTSYTPTHTEFKISGSYDLKELTLKVEHMCLHPLETYKKIPVKKFAGYTKVGVYWNCSGP